MCGAELQSLPEGVQRVARALQADRQAAAFGGFLRLRAHLGQRIEDTPHRPLA